MTIPLHARIVEVGPRDGLQNEKEIIPAVVKIALIDRLSATGLTHIESGAFVSPKWVPQMADTAQVYAGINRKNGVVYPALVPNDRGMQSAIESGVEEIAVFAAASEEFSQKNIHCSIDESLARFSSVVQAGKAHGIKIRGYISCVAGCPYQGDVRPEKVGEIARKLYEMGCYEISLGDTIGVATPNKIQAVLYDVMDHVPVNALALHCHDTYGQALANIYAGLQMGVSVFDSSVAGLGGCPYATGATGNVATEDLLYMLNGLGIKTGVNLDRLIEASWFISDYLGRKPASNVANALGAKIMKESS